MKSCLARASRPWPRCRPGLLTRRFVGSIASISLFTLLLATDAAPAEPAIPATHDQAIRAESVNLGRISSGPGPASLQRPRHALPEIRGTTPGNLPVPPSALRRPFKSSDGPRSQRLPNSSTVGGTVQLSDLLPSPAPSAGFQGLDDDGTTTAADTSGAVGPNHVMTVLSSRIRIQTRDGATLLTTTLDRFFSVLGDGVVTYDPRCLYDPYSGRWMISAAINPYQPDASIALAVSLSSDPTGDWYRYSVPVDPAGALMPYSPAMGFNVRWIAIQANLFNQVSGEFVESQVFAFDKADVYAGGTGLFARFHLPAADYGGSQTPAITMDPDLPKLYLVESWTGSYAESATSKPEGLLRIFAIEGELGAEQLNPGNFVNTGQETFDPPFVWADWLASGADQGLQNGTTNRIQLGDSRIQSVMYRGGTLWCAQTVLLPAAAPTRSGAQWWEIFEDGRLFQRHLVDDPGGLWSYAYPSLAVNNHYDVLLGYSGFAAAVFPSAYYRFYPNDGTYNNPQGERLMRAGEGNYFDPFAGQNLWGDWSAACVDPLNDGALWTLQEYALPPGAADAGRWGVWWSQVVPPSTLRLALSPSTNGVTVGQPFSWSLTLSNQVLSFAYGVAVTLPVPPGFDFQSVQNTNGAAFLSNGVIHLSLDRVGVAPLGCLILGVANGATTNITATATASVFGDDPGTALRSSTASVTLLNAAPVLSPRLGVGRLGSDGALRLSWPVGYLGMQLESRNVLNEGPWVPVTTPAKVDGASRTTEIPFDAAQRYYRLRWTGQ